MASIGVQFLLLAYSLGAWSSSTACCGVQEKVDDEDVLEQLARQIEELASSSNAAEWRLAESQVH